jgi:small subunit ribosomal protein S6
VKTYEASVVFKPILDLDTAEGGILGNFEATIKNLGGEVVRTEKVGRKRLAYEINKFKDGYIVNMIVSLPTQAIAPLRKHCQYNEDVLRLTILTMTEKAVELSANTNTTVASQNAPLIRDNRMAGGGGRRDFGGGGNREFNSNRPPRTGGYNAAPNQAPSDDQAVTAG